MDVTPDGTVHVQMPVSSKVTVVTPADVLDAGVQAGFDAWATGSGIPTARLIIKPLAPMMDAARATRPRTDHMLASKRKK
jgi:hypothetical protein